jgi:hypothetical protein
MTITAQSIIQRAVGVLQDTTSVRWPMNELVRWLNDAQREVVTYRPDAMNTTATMTLAAGSRQDLDNGTLTPAPSKLIEITRNMAATSTKGAVTQVPRKIMDDQTPGWHNLAGSVNVLHYMFDARDPKTFYVYPPATILAQLEVMYSAYPTDIVEPIDGALYTAVVGNISLPDIYGNALLDYILYRAYTKDSEYAGNLQRAQAHYAAFANTMGVEVKSTVAVAPQLRPGLTATAAA